MRTWVVTAVGKGSPRLCPRWPVRLPYYLLAGISISMELSWAELNSYSWLFKPNLKTLTNFESNLICMRSDPLRSKFWTSRRNTPNLEHTLWDSIVRTYSETLCGNKIGLIRPYLNNTSRKYEYEKTYVYRDTCVALS